MTANQVYESFKRMFPGYVNDQIVYFPNGKNSIRIRGVKDFDDGEIIFTVTNNQTEWKLESVRNFIKRMKEGSNNA